MRKLLQSVILSLVILPVLPAFADPYLAFSVGTSFENHSFDVWSGSRRSPRRALNGHSASKDQAIAIGFSNAFSVHGHPFDIELEVFERRNAKFVATGTSGAHATRIKTNSIMAAIWTRVAGNETRGLYLGAGVGARNSSYKMTGPGVRISAMDHAPYAMIGARVKQRVNQRVALFVDVRAHTRPPVRLQPSLGNFSGPLEHNSEGFTVRFGVQIGLGH